MNRNMRKMYTEEEIGNLTKENLYTKDYIDTELSKKANISGANFTGGITSPSIVENMTGYSFEIDSPSDTTITGIYASAVKNGNKLTLVWYFKLNRLSSGVSYGAVGNFKVPSDVFNKLYPTIVW